MPESYVELKFTAYSILMAKLEHTQLGDIGCLEKIKFEAEQANLNPTERLEVDRHDLPPWGKLMLKKLSERNMSVVL